MTFFEKLEQEVTGVFSRHAGEIESVLADADKVASSKTAQAALLALHMPPEVDNAVAGIVTALEGVFARLAPATEAPKTATPDPTATTANPATGGTSTAPSSDSAGSGQTATGTASNADAAAAVAAAQAATAQATQQ